MIKIDKPNRKKLAELYKEYQWNYLPDAVLDGTVGEARADDLDNPRVAVLEFPRLRLFIPGGDAGCSEARNFLQSLTRPSMLIFASEGWEALLKKTHPGKSMAIQQYAFTSEKLDRSRLQGLAAAVPEGYRLERMDLGLAQQLADEESEFSADHMTNFDSPRDFIERGFGYCALADDEIISAATTFVVCDKGIEIQINTRADHRRKGLATVVASNLMLHSLQNGLDPSWDAENTRSARLAEKLGYTPQGRYSLWIVVDSRLKLLVLKTTLRIRRLLRP